MHTFPSFSIFIFIQAMKLAPMPTYRLKVIPTVLAYFRQSFIYIYPTSQSLLFLLSLQLQAYDTTFYIGCQPLLYQIELINTRSVLKTHQTIQNTHTPQRGLSIIGYLAAGSHKYQCSQMQMGGYSSCL